MIEIAQAILTKAASDIAGLEPLVYAAIFGVAAYWIHRYNKYDGIMRQGLVYKWSGGSGPNPPRKMWKRGHRWTEVSTLEGISKKFSKVDLPVKFNQFRYFDRYVEYCKMPKFIRKRAEELEVYFDAEDLARGVLVIGSAGSGKTEFVNTIISQKFYKKAVIFSKKGDFEQFFFRPGIDILVNPKLEQGVVHDILSEDIQYIMEYINTLMSASIGGNQDYFSGSAKQKLENFCQRIKIRDKDSKLEIFAKWQALIEFYENAMQEAQNSDQKSEKDIMSTVRATMNMLYLAAYRVDQGARTFTAKDFFNSKQNQKLFLNSTDPSMDGMLSATSAVLIKYQLAMKDIKLWDPHFLVSYFLDEYLSFAKVIDNEILSEISRVGRSKGIVPFKFVQSLPKDEEERKELTSNVEYQVIFAATESEITLKYIKEQIGEVEFERIKISESFTGNKRTIQKSTEDAKEAIITNYDINILQKEGFSHLLFAPKKEILYKGYTPPQNLKKRDYIEIEKEIDLAEFYRWKIEREDALDAIKKASKGLKNNN